MATKTKLIPQKYEMPEQEGAENSSDSPLLDLSNAAVIALMRTVKEHLDPRRLFNPGRFVDGI